MHLGLAMLVAIRPSTSVSTGVGVAAMPDVWVQSQPELSNLVKIRDGFDTETWILTPAEMRNVPRIKLCMNVIKTKL